MIFLSLSLSNSGCDNVSHKDGDVKITETGSNENSNESEHDENNVELELSGLWRISQIYDAEFDFTFNLPSEIAEDCNFDEIKDIYISVDYYFHFDENVTKQYISVNVERPSSECDEFFEDVQEMLIYCPTLDKDYTLSGNQLNDWQFYGNPDEVWSCSLEDNNILTLSDPNYGWIKLTTSSDSEIGINEASQDCEIFDMFNWF